jgi:hypothetical protein
LGDDAGHRRAHDRLVQGGQQQSQQQTGQRANQLLPGKIMETRARRGGSGHFSITPQRRQGVVAITIGLPPVANSVPGIFTKCGGDRSVLALNRREIVRTLH